MRVPKESCKTNLLSDVPASEDSFGAHSSVAEAIAGLIAEEDGGISIGLQGTWGSGKSTVMNLIARRLTEDSAETAPVVFDAWAHQGDPLRRSFLEALIDELGEREWVSSDYLREVKDKLARRRKVEHKTSNPILKPLGAVMAGGALLIPLGLTLFNSALSESITLAWLGWQNVSFKAIAGIALALNPLLSYAAAYAGWSIKKARGKTDEDWADVGGWNALLLRKYSTQELTETVADQEPTSVEFEGIFGDLLDRGLEESERRLVLILDNLDRVAPEDGLKMLSTLQTFMQDSFSRDRNWFNRLWIVIPYAQDGMRLLLEKNSDTGEDGLSVPGMTERFLEKRLQIRFEVPPIVRSDWGKFLEKQLEIAFPEHPKIDNEFHLVYRVFDLARADRSLPPTPREMKLFVNQIGALHRQWFDKYPLHHLAYYAVLSKNGDSIIGQLREGSLPAPSVRSILGEDSADTLAALAFGVDVSKARELMLMPGLIEALQNNNVGRLERIARLHPSGIWPVLEGVPFNDWPISESRSLASAASTLLLFGFQDKAPDGFRTSTIDSLGEAFAAVNRWEPLDETTGRGIAAMLHMKPNPTLAERLVQVVAAPIEEVEGEGASELGIQWLETLIPLLDAIHELGLEAVLVEGVPVPGNEAWIVKIVSSLEKVESTSRYAKYLRSDLPPEKVGEHLKEAITSGSITSEDVKALDVIRELFSGLDWQGVGECALQRLNNPASFDPQEIAAMLHVLWKLTKWEVVPVGKLKQLANSDHVLHHLHHARTRESPEAIAWCLLTQIAMRPDASQPPNPVGNSADGWSFFNSALGNPSDHEAALDEFNRIVDANELHQIIVETASKIAGWRPWLMASANELIRNGAALKVVGSGEYAEKHEFLKATLDEDTFSSLTGSLVKQGEVIDTAMKEPFDSETGEFYVDLIDAGGHANSAFNSWISDSLKTIDAATWTTALTSKTYLIELVVKRYEKGGRYKLGLPYADGVLDYAKRLIDGEAEAEDPQILSQNFLSVIWGDERAALRRTLLDSAMATDGEIASSFFDVFGSEIADIEMIKNDTDVVRKMFEPIVRKPNLPGLAWLAGLFARDSELLTHYKPKYAVTQFRARVEKAAAEGLEDELADSIRSITKPLGIEIPHSDDDDIASDTKE